MYKGLKGKTKEDIEILISSTIYLLKNKKLDTVSYPFFQRLLRIDGNEAIVIVGELAEMGILKESYTDPEEEDHVIYDIDYEMLKEFLKN